MTQTQRSVAEIYALLPDNITEDISPQDHRDSLATWRMGHGQIYVPAAASAPIIITNTDDYFEAIDPEWTLSAGGHFFDESGGNGRLTYIGLAPVTLHIACTISMTSGSNNQITHWRLGKNAVPDEAAEVQRKIMTGTDVGSTALHLVEAMSTGDYVSLWVRNASGANDVTLEVANLQAMTMPA
ncbi:MAG: hypothetical protein V3U46_04040 [Acidimicrobiia bacterium]